MKSVWYEKEIKEMIKEVASAQDEKAVEEIFDVILTPREINDMSRRLKIKKMLESGSTYSEISLALGVGPVIISRISNQIGYGFRRASAENQLEVKKPKAKKPVRKYKGATPITKMFG